jgi:hypothetical protein
VTRYRQWTRGARLAALVAIAAVLLTGCIDVVQYISGSGSEIDVYLRLALQKSAFEMANSMSGEPEDLDEMFEEEFELDRETVFEELPPGIEAAYEPVNDEFEYGFELTYTASREALAMASQTGEGAFVPRVGTRGMTIPLAEGGGGEEGSQGEADRFASAFLGGAKYRVFISRRLVSRVSSARLASGDRSTDVTVIELPDVWMIQFPVSLWLMSDETPSIEIVY